MSKKQVNNVYPVREEDQDIYSWTENNDLEYIGSSMRHKRIVTRPPKQYKEKKSPVIRREEKRQHNTPNSAMLSFSLDFSDVFSNSSTIVNGLFPVYLVPLGLTLGIGILAYIIKLFVQMIKQ